MKDLSQASQGMSITDILIDKKKPEDIPPEQAKALEEVCSGDPKISAEFLSDTDDPLVRAIYTITKDGEVVFPLGNGVDPQTPKCHGHLGEHRSDWHKESVGKHTAVVVSRSCRGIGCRRSTEYVLTVLIAFFHDLAKKRRNFLPRARPALGLFRYAMVGEDSWPFRQGKAHHRHRRLQP